MSSMLTSMTSMPLSRQICSSVICLATLCAITQGKEAVFDWENEQVLQINREPARATFVPFEDAEQVLGGDRAASPWFLSLNGPWRFHWVPRTEERPADFYRTDFDDSGWKTLPVPSNWEMHGHGTPIYVSAGYPFKIDPPRVTSEPQRAYTAFNQR